MTRTDAELLRRAGHDPEAFREFYDRLARDLLRQYHKHSRIATAGRRRMGMAAPFAGCEDLERVDERSEARALAPLLRHVVRALTTQMTGAQAMSAR